MRSKASDNDLVVGLIAVTVAFTIALLTIIVRCFVAIIASPVVAPKTKRKLSCVQNQNNKLTFGRGLFRDHDDRNIYPLKASGEDPSSMGDVKNTYRFDQLESSSFISLYPSRDRDRECLLSLSLEV